MAESLATRRHAWAGFGTAVRHRRRFVLLIAASFSIGAALYAATLPTLYLGRAVIALVPRAEAGTGSDDAIEISIPIYAAELSSPSTLDDVAGEVGVGRGDLSDELNIIYSIETSTIELETQLPSSVDAAAAANALAEIAVARSATDRFVEAEVVSRALPDGDPDAPRRGMMGLAALGAGAVIGSAWSIYAERTRPSLRTTRDVTRATGLRALAGVPRSRVFRKRPREALSHPEVGGAFRTLRANVLRATSGRTKPVIAVVSPKAGEGKTTIAAILAESIARLGKEVLLIDADLARPAVAKRFMLDPQGSLSAALRGTVGLDRAMKQGWVPGFHVLTTKADREAGDLIPSRLPEILEEALRGVDFVVIDCPPILSTSEGRAVTAMATDVLVVVRVGSRVDELLEAIGAAEPLGTPVMGVVLNAVPGDAEVDYRFG